MVASVAIMPALPAQAADDTSSSSLSIAPRKNYVVDPGKSVGDTITIRNNDSQSPLNLTVRVIDFTFNDETGTPKLMVDPSAPQTVWSLKPFLTVPTTVTVPPSSSKTINLKVSVPAGQGAGSYYSAIMYSSGSGDTSNEVGQGKNVGLSASGVTLVFVTVPGQVKENLELKKFGAYDRAVLQKDRHYITFTTQEPQYMAYTLLNTGNVAESPVGQITLKDMFGHEYNISDANPVKNLALREQTRTFDVCIKSQDQKVDVTGAGEADTNRCTSPGLWPGYYKASLDLFYGQNGNQTQEITKTVIFWYMPWWFIILLIIVFLIVVYIVWRVVQFFRGGRSGSGPRRRISRRRLITYRRKN